MEEGQAIIQVGQELTMKRLVYDLGLRRVDKENDCYVDDRGIYYYFKRIENEKLECVRVEECKGENKK